MAGVYREKRKKKKREARGPCLGGGHTHHARCTRTRIAHAHTQQNHREWATPSLTSKASAHGECHGGAFPIVVVFIVKGVSVATRGLAIGDGENNTAEGPCTTRHFTTPAGGGTSTACDGCSLAWASACCPSLLQQLLSGQDWAAILALLVHPPELRETLVVRPPPDAFRSGGNRQRWT